RCGGSKCSGLAQVAMRRERERCDRGRERLAAHDELNARARLRKGRIDVAHGDRSIDARAETARGDGPDLLAVEGLHLGAVACGRAAVRLDADAHAARAVPQLALDAIRAREAALDAAPLLD